MINQHPFTFLGKIQPERKDELRTVLKAINQNLTNNEYLNFNELKTVHFARFVVLDEVVKNDRIIYPPYLVFSSNYDGKLDPHLYELLRFTDFNKVFGACINFPGSGASIDRQIEFLKSHSNYKAYFYRGTWGRSVNQIQEEENARKAAETYIDNHPEIHTMSPNQIKHSISKHLVDINLMRKFPEIIRPSVTQWWKLALAGFTVLCFLPLIPGIFLPVCLIFLAILRYHEKRDEIQEEKYSDLSQTTALQDSEDKIIQNQLTHLVEIKPGKFRQFTLKLALSGIYFLARNYYNKGRLGNIETIHFARWVIIDKGKRLLFFSNFDGSWESYLSDFVDRAAVGLTGVWSNTIGFPKARFLLFKGAKDEQRFKAWTRRNQVYTDVWYSAYKDLTVKNINNNTEINNGFFKKMHEEELEEFLRRY